jgi:hypothetical protein
MMYNDRSRVSRGAYNSSRTGLRLSLDGLFFLNYHPYCAFLMCSAYSIPIVLSPSTFTGLRWSLDEFSHSCPMCWAVLTIFPWSPLHPSRCHDVRCSTFALRSTRTALVNV